MSSNVSIRIPSTEIGQHGLSLVLSELVWLDDLGREQLQRDLYKRIGDLFVATLEKRLALLRKLKKARAEVGWLLVLQWILVH
jgi:hypothetical protein